MNDTKRLEIFRRFREKLPSPTTELRYGSNFELLVAVVLSAQATDKSVNRATVGLFAEADSPRAMVRLGMERVAQHIQSIGLYRTKAKNVVALSQLLEERHAGVVPADRAALEALPGVGRKTANVVLNTAFGQPTIAVDTHIFRVANRTGIARGKDVVAVENGLLKKVPKAYQQNAHHWLILHGRYVCKAQRPQCANCLIADLCDYAHSAASRSKGQS